jgi:hypothetical protein
MGDVIISLRSPAVKITEPFLIPTYLSSIRRFWQRDILSDSAGKQYRVGGTVEVDLIQPILPKDQERM